MATKACVALVLIGALGCSGSSGGGGNGPGPAGGGGGGSCVSVLQEDDSGGCTISLDTPANGEAITLPYTFGWTASGCEAPFTIVVCGDGASPQCVEGQVSTAEPNTRSAATITFDDSAKANAPPSASGVYQWQVKSFYGATSAGRTFTLAPATCG